MLAVLKSESESGDFRKLSLRYGEQLQVGRSEWADWVWPADLQMADVHFRLTFGEGGCRLFDLSGGATLVNSKPIVSTSWLRTGDCIEAGATSFIVEFGRINGTSPVDAEASAQVDGPPGVADDLVFSRFPVASIEMIADWAELDENASSRIADAPSVEVAVAALSAVTPAAESVPASDGNKSMKPAPATCPNDDRFLSDAVRLLAFALPIEAGVRWACDTVEAIHSDALSANDSAALAAARSWRQADSDTSRRIAMDAAETAGLQSAASWAAVAAAWSQGPNVDGVESAPEDDSEADTDADQDPEKIMAVDSPAIDPHANHCLSAKAVAGAVTFAVIDADPARTTALYRTAIEFGRTMYLELES
jgi:hypothetical protein